ncbi:F-box protein At5g06550 [Durusdinium trenchii]|uniref:F-box protein At5g06550 n=1 Tax=Durusdinium trenchii TaxID=1381693 RepID=A0ABP0HJQ0_9DINO
MRDVVSKGERNLYGVKPEGHRFALDGKEDWDLVLDKGKGWGAQSLGKLANDELWLLILSMLDVKSLARMSCVSRVVFVFCSADHLWKDLALKRWRENGFLRRFDFLGSWRQTVLKFKKQLYRPKAIVLSDTLFRPWQYGTAEVDARWLRREEVETLDASKCTVDDFVQRFEIPNKPVLIHTALAQALAGIQELGGHPHRADDMYHFRVGPVNMRLCDFLDYAERQTEESPLYLFDCKFVERAWSTGNDFRVPELFRNTKENGERDLLAYMGHDRRPDYRWLIAGAARSGSKWHIDPNGTHAWNGVVSGCKRWLMFPPGHPPPGVTPSADGAEVTQPVSLMEWFVNFYHIEAAPVEFTARSGDLVFVPSRWWHCVLNLEACVAVTQNYIARSNLASALRFMRDTPENVSGLADHRSRAALYRDFREALRLHHPDLLDAFDDNEAKLAKDRELREEMHNDTTFSFEFF